MEPLVDAHGRPITDLRVSVTDRCNFRCRYCMPAEGMPWLDRSELLSFEEIERLVGLLARLGITDVRLTGGEPLARREFPKLVSMLRRIDGIRDLSVTTNGYLLERDAAALVEAGIDRINVSIDSLARDRFHEITRRDALPQVLRGLEAIAAFERVRPIKVNAVAMRDFTEDEVFGFCELARSTDYQVRFIEFMPLDGDRAWSADQVLTGDELRALIETRHTARAAAARTARDRPRLSVPRRRRRDRLHQPGLGAVLRRLQPHPPDRRRRASHLPVLDPRDRSARAAARRRGRRGARAHRARRGLAQGAQAPGQRAGLRRAAADDERDRRLTASGHTASHALTYRAVPDGHTPGRSMCVGLHRRRRRPGRARR